MKKIFVDETLLKVDGREYWLWIIAYEPKLNDACLMMHLSRERTVFVCYQQFFKKQLRNRYGGRKPIFTADGALWYNSTACIWLLRLKHEVYSIKMKKNVMERFIIQYPKDRTECFDDHFPCRKEGCNRQHV